MIHVRGDLSICHFDDPAVEPIDVEVNVSSEHRKPVLEIHTSETTTWRIRLSRDAAALLAGLLAAEAGVKFDAA